MDIQEQPILTRKQHVENYMQTFTPVERNAHIVAIEYLGESFDIECSVGFIEYMQAYNKRQSALVKAAAVEP